MEDALAKPRVVSEPSVQASESPASQERVADAGAKKDIDLYVTYSLDHDVPFIADYYGIGNLMDYRDLSYKAEVDAIDNYLVDEIKAKRLDNTTEAVSKRLKQLEKIAGIEPIAPTSVRVKQLAAYSDYLKKLSDINQSVVF